MLVINRGGGFIMIILILYMTTYNIIIIYNNYIYILCNYNLYIVIVNIYIFI